MRLDWSVSGGSVAAWTTSWSSSPFRCPRRRAREGVYVEKAGFNADHDHQVSDELRFVQLTPPGSACSIAIGTGLGDSEPGSMQGLHLPGGAFVFFSDPDGNGWVVQEPSAG